MFIVTEYAALINRTIISKWSNVLTQDRRLSKTFILLTNVDQNRWKQNFRLPFVAGLATNGNQKPCFQQFLIRVRQLLIAFLIAPIQCST